MPESSLERTLPLLALAWLRYGRVPMPNADEADALLDRFMPVYDVVERHHVQIAAPAAITLAAAEEQDLLHLPLVHAIFKARELVLGAAPDTGPQPRGLLAQMQALGWGVLADEPGREIVVGAVTKPWEPNPTFRALPPDDSPRFATRVREDRVDACARTPSASRHQCSGRKRARSRQTRLARSRFRRYWALASPGIALIRRLSLRPLKHDAERRARESLPKHAP